jgi:hypothetical protein
MLICLCANAEDKKERYILKKSYKTSKRVSKKCQMSFPKN